MWKISIFRTFILAICMIFNITDPVISYGQVARTDDLLRREMKERRIPGLQVAIVQKGKIVLLRSYGMADIEQAVPVSNHSMFSINSCTKAFTGVAIMQLVDEGKVALQAPVSRYLDSLPEKWQAVTIRQLLTHVSGLPDILHIISRPGYNKSEQEAWAETMTAPMEFTTGEQFSYNQTNYVLLGRIIDKFSGMPFIRAFEERQFKPAGMKHTCFGDSYDVIPDAIPTYRYISRLYGETLPEPKLTRNVEEFPPYRRTASGMKSTAEDLARWIIALQKQQLFRTAAALDTLWKAGVYNNGQPTQWALGWVTRPRPQHRAVTATGGGRAAFFVYPDDDLAIVVLTNLAGSYPEDFIDELAGFYNPAIAAADPVTALRMQLRQRGYEHAWEVYQELKKANAGFQPSETDLNDWAYRVQSRGKKKEALEIFRLNMLLFPDSWNVYDSYGEALLQNNRKEEAIKMYQKSILLNPQNNNGKRVLETLQQQ
ncbi:serine hydrolase [Chitinophaga solisilvae]|uniref:serine hydrolase n=1 Tax=Chitinophaga solisilvae TaxID=1233460 RepID=UPI001370B2EB|nr:serine hydrolase [Chitinophaga solisilvae]